jgi:predicted protein tyrosine phosphatase
MKYKIITRSHKNLKEAIDAESSSMMFDSFIVIRNTADDESSAPPEIPCGRVLELAFDDVYANSPLGGKAIVLADAEKIAEFIINIPAGEQATIHVSCNAGQSRSTGVAEALSNVLSKSNNTVEIEHTSPSINPNKIVNELVTKAFLLKTKKKRK